MGTKQARLSVNLFSLSVNLFSVENRTRELNWKVTMGALPPWCIMVPDITWKGAFGQVAQGKASNLRGREETITVAIKMLKGAIFIVLKAF